MKGQLLDKIQVDETMIQAVEFLHYEVNGYVNVLERIMIKIKDTENYDYDKEIYDHFMTEYRGKNLEYNSVKTEVMSLYLPKEYFKKEIIFNFIDCTLDIYEKEDKGCSSCHI